MFLGKNKFMLFFQISDIQKIGEMMKLAIKAMGIHISGDVLSAAIENYLNKHKFCGI